MAPNKSADGRVTFELDEAEMSAVIEAMIARRTWPGHAEIIRYLEYKRDHRRLTRAGKRKPS
jgi:hypothetical protein